MVGHRAGQALSRGPKRWLQALARKALKADSVLTGADAGVRLDYEREVHSRAGV
ncbi:hypothetical protein [Nocardioides yefusunii]|uniref:Uncharacterized protein n=1 Tax=Nocardioides yefusunii TaxID=2500546 RepID=A0ABW1QYU7_9ACTN|nr:hypothetical protein [Nocardioides yefusunii]